MYRLPINQQFRADMRVIVISSLHEVITYIKMLVKPQAICDPQLRPD